MTQASVSLDDVAATPNKSTTTVAMDFGRIYWIANSSFTCLARQDGTVSGSCGMSSCTELSALSYSSIPDAWQTAFPAADFFETVNCRTYWR